MKKTLFLCLATFLLLFSSCSNDDDNNQNQLENFLKIGNTTYELKTGTIEDYGEFQPGVFNFDIVLFSSVVNSIGGEFIPEDQIFSGIYFELFTGNEDDLGTGTYTKVNLANIGAQTFEYAEIAENVEFDNQDETGTYSDLISGSFSVISNGPEYEFEFSGVDDLGNNISGHFRGTLIPVN